LFGLGTSTHVCSQSINDHYIIKQHGSHAPYGCWTIKALVKAEVLYDGFTVSCGCIAAPLIIARPLGVSILISNYKTSIKPILKGKCFGNTGGVHVHHLWLSNKPSSSNLAQNLVGKKIALPG
jgi:hypothetical protein